jgi:tetratricopeptide (TPR) repeat protein
LTVLRAISGQTPGRAFLFGWVAGIVGHGGGFSRRDEGNNRPDRCSFEPLAARPYVAFRDRPFSAMKRHHITYYSAAAISLITFLVYLGSLQNGFVNWDDPAYIYENPHIRSFDPALVRWAFLDFYASNWHPLAWISHAMDVAVWGLNPLGHHLTSNILHAINTFLVVVLATMLVDAGRDTVSGSRLPEPRHDRAVLVTAGVTGLFFGLHPLHVESVAWVSERKDLLCALFFLLSLIAYVKYARDADGNALHRKSSSRLLNKHYLLSFGFLCLALLSKPMAVSLPFIALLFDWYPLRRVRSFKAFQTLFKEKIPFIAAVLVSSTLTILAQKSEGALSTLEHVPLPARLLVASRSIVAYLGKMVLPFDLVPYYPYPREVDCLSPRYLIPVLLVPAITLICLRVAKKQGQWLSVWGYYVISLVPVIGIVQVGGQAMADRYTYLPSIGPFFLAGLAAAWVSRKVDAVKKRVVLSKIVMVGSAGAIFAALAVLTMNQTGIWKDSITFWSNVIQRTSPELSSPYENRGSAFFAIGQCDKAIEDFDRVILLDPGNGKIYYNRGVAYLCTGSFDKAIASFSKALEINPNDADTYVNRGVAYDHVGLQEKAIEDFDTGIRLDRNHAVAYQNRGNVYAAMGKKALALRDFRMACDLGNGKACQTLITLRKTAGDAH